MERIIIKRARIIDANNNGEKVVDILIEGSKIVKIADMINLSKNAQIISAEGMFVLPGLVDLHAHLREPGREDEEDLYSGSLAALKGGFTTLCCMANTEPALDNPGLIRYLLDKSQTLNLINIYPVGTITVKREGKALSEMWRMCQAGAIAFSDDGDWIADSALMRRAMEYARELNRILILHCEDKSLSRNGCINEGILSLRLGLPGIPREAEIIAVARDLELAKLTGSSIHITHISCKESIELIKRAKAKGLEVTCDTCPHYLVLNEEYLSNYDTNFKVNPPLRTEEDRYALIDAIKDDIIDCITTDHAPHAQEEKDCEFELAPFGIIGLETALGLCFKVAEQTNIEFSKIVKKLSLSPAQILGLKDRGLIAEGLRADIIVIAPEEYQFCKSDIVSRSKNTPFIGWKLKQRVRDVIVNGEIKMANYNFIKEGQ